MGNQHSSGPRSGHSMTNLPPLLFNSVHGENVSITENGTVARRVSSFCKAIVFSDRPVRINEKVCIKFLEVSTNWSGVLRFGFTSNDPTSLRSCLPRYACPDLTTKSGFWAKAFSDVHVKKDAILYYYVNQAGEVHFGINGDEKSVFFAGVDTRGPLWALVDIYGNTTGIEFVDNRAHLNNLRQSSTDVSQTLVPSLSSLSVGGGSSLPENSSEREFPSSRFYSGVIPGLHFHRTKGQHAEIGLNRVTASRRISEYSNGYVFISRPIEPGESFVIKVAQSDPDFAGSLAVGVTSCDPMTIHFPLPDDSHALLDRPEYWVVKKDVANGPVAGDELCFSFTIAGEMLMSKNAGSPTTLMHVDNSIPLWSFFDLYGTTIKVHLLGKLNRSASSMADTTANAPTWRPSRAPLPRSQSSTLAGPVSNANLSLTNVHNSQNNLLQPTSPPAMSAWSQASLDVFTSNALNNGDLERQGLSNPSTNPREMNNWSVECVICCERPVDSVFYSCGHMCMCFVCASNFWKTKDKGCCPICRAEISDVIRTYKS